MPWTFFRFEQISNFYSSIKGVPPFVEWSLSGKENIKEEMEIWPCNDYNKRGRSADITLRFLQMYLVNYFGYFLNIKKASLLLFFQRFKLRPKLGRPINAIRYADKHGAAVYYNSLAGKNKTHRKQIDLILPREVKT